MVFDRCFLVGKGRVPAPRGATAQDGGGGKGFEVHGLVDVRRKAQGSHATTKLREPLAVHESSPSSPCERKRGRERCQGRADAGANVEEVAVALRGQRVVALVRSDSTNKGKKGRVRRRAALKHCILTVSNYNKAVLAPLALTC